MMFLSFNNDVDKLVLFLVSLLPIILTCEVQEERDHCPLPGAQLEHVCVNLHSLPEEGVPVIMLHGITDTKESWDGIYQNIPLLAHRRVCIYDARNHGDSSWNDTFNVDVLAEDLGRFMNDMKIENVALVGHSMGGLTAMKFALKNPQKVERLLVEDISIRIPDDIVENIDSYLKILVDSLSAIPDDADEDTAKKAVSDFVFEATKAPPPDHLFKKFPFRRRDGKWQWKSNFDAFRKAFKVQGLFLSKMEGLYNGKILFIYGKASVFKVENDEKAIRELFPNAEFFGVEGADHVIHPKHPEFLRQLINFLK